LDDLKDFAVNRVFIRGELLACEGRYLPEVRKHDISSVKGSVVVKDFSKEKLLMHLKSDEVYAIEIVPGGVVTKKAKVKVRLDERGEFVFDEANDVVKIAVVERHKGTGNVACAFLKGYGIKTGAVAISIAHDSHNIIVVGTSDDEMEFAVKSLCDQCGGIVLVNGGKVVESMPMPIAGLMSDKTGEWVDERLTSIHDKAFEVLGVNKNIDPVMTLCFMSLPVIPELKLTDMGLFDVGKFDFIKNEIE
ncbi:MAG: adenine deaminase, partial [Lachnospiraceae bacterium]|nr:adenine deaminase [Lachnospiraceae bacterium]